MSGFDLRQAQPIYLCRTTLSVAPTQAGERLLGTIGPKFDEIDVELAALSEPQEKPAGTIRITSTEYAADPILMPPLGKILPKYPDIKVEVVVDYGLTNIVSEQYDAGIRPGEMVAKATPGADGVNRRDGMTPPRSMMSVAYRADRRWTTSLSTRATIATTVR
jgi:DNA-binding transcriptional LysR family regulator